MISKRYSIPGFILLCIVHSTFAADVELSPQPDSCLKKAGSETAEMISCTIKEYKHQDALLDTLYNKLMEDLSAERRIVLAKAQDEWGDYLSTTCDFYGDPKGGTLARQLQMDCYMYKTAERVAELKTFKLLNY